MKSLLSILAVVSAFIVSAQIPTPGAPQERPIAIIGGTAHTGTGEVIENAYIFIEEGKITAIGDMSAVRIDRSRFEIIDVTGQQVYPGFIQLNTTLGLEDISAVKASRDDREIGDFTPNVRSLIAYNTDSWHIPAQRHLGVLLAQPTPRGGYMPGTSSVVQLDAWNWEDAAYAADNGLHLVWPSPTYGARWWMGETERRENRDYDDQVAMINEIFEDAKAYISYKGDQKSNLKLEAIAPVFSGEKTLFIEASRRRQIVESVQWALEMGIEHVVIVEPRDAHLCIDFLAEYDIPVVLPQVHAMPARSDGALTERFELPKLLHDAGVKVALSYDDLQEARNLPFFAGTATAYGLEYEDALAMITLNAAEILRIDDRTGSLEVGKDANIIVSSGDLLDMRTNNVTLALIQGRKLDLNGPQQQLYEKYKNKP